MKISIDTKEDSHEEIKKVIRMLQNLVGDSQEIFTNEPSSAQESSQIANIFGDTSNLSTQSTPSSETTQETSAEQAQSGETSESTEDLFAELFSEEELKKMEPVKEPEDEEEQEEAKPKKKKYGIELY